MQLYFVYYLCPHFKLNLSFRERRPNRGEITTPGITPEGEKKKKSKTSFPPHPQPMINGDGGREDV